MYPLIMVLHVFGSGIYRIRTLKACVIAKACRGLTKRKNGTERQRWLKNELNRTSLNPATSMRCIWANSFRSFDKSPVYYLDIFHVNIRKRVANPSYWQHLPMQSVYYQHFNAMPGWWCVTRFIKSQHIKLSLYPSLSFVWNMLQTFYEVFCD